MVLSVYITCQVQQTAFVLTSGWDEWLGRLDGLVGGPASHPFLPALPPPPRAPDLEPLSSWANHYSMPIVL